MSDGKSFYEPTGGYSVGGSILQKCVTRWGQKAETMSQIGMW